MEKVDQGQCCTRNPKRTDVREEASGATCNNAIRNRDLMEWLRLGSERTFIRTFRKTVGLKIMKQIARQIFCQDLKNECRILWRGQHPPKQKKKPLTA
jgi:hypothetical protein